MKPSVDMNIQANSVDMMFRIIVSVKDKDVEAVFEIGANRIKDLYSAIKLYEDEGYSSEDFTESARRLPL